MMIGERTHPSIQVPPWPSSPPPDTTTTNHSPFYPTTNSIDSPAASSPSSYLLNDAALAALSRFLPSADLHSDADSLSDPDSAAAIDAYSCDEFRMYEFKVRRCARGRSHDWTECPYAHPGEKARRRDPRRYHYSGAACPDFRKGSCKRGDACEFAHGVFECWLHPARYRTQPCKDGVACRRRVCFFAHTPEQLRVLPGSVAGMAAAAQQQQSPRGCGGGSTPGGGGVGGCMTFDSYDGSPMRQHHHLNPTSLEAYFPKTMLPTSSPTSTLMSPPISPPSDSPPLSPSSGPQSLVRRGSSSMTEMLGSLRQLQLNSSSPWMQMAGSPPMAVVRRCPPPPFSSVPSTPTGPVCGTQVILRKPGGGGLFDGWDDPSSPMAVVESGRDLRAKLAEKLSKENSLGRPVDGSAAGAGPDVGWVSDLVN